MASSVIVRSGELVRIFDQDKKIIYSGDVETVIADLLQTVVARDLKVADLEERNERLARDFNEISGRRGV